jgi:hypothetical protein
LNDTIDFSAIGGCVPRGAVGIGWCSCLGSEK